MYFIFQNMNLDKNIGINRIHIKLLVLFDKYYISLLHFIFLILHILYISTSLTSQTRVCMSYFLRFRRKIFTLVRKSPRLDFFLSISD